ncbi:MAG: hypothetical protein U1C71_00365, partial [archaeon]|nr:hypothetical protein [archaeon]
YNELKTNIRLEGVGASIHASRNRKLSENLADIPHQVAGFRYLDGKCLMMRGSAVPKIGHIPSTILNDDLFISLRLGIENVRRIPSARVVYHPPASIRETWKQAVRQWKGVLQLRKMFGRKRVNAFVNPSVLRAFQRGISAYSSLSSKQRMALWAAPVFYSAVKARSYLGRKGGGTWKMQKSTKRGTR